MSPNIPSRRVLAAAILSGLVAAQAAQAQQSAPDAAPPQQNLETVIVTGTRALNRTVGESLSPIDIITSDTLQSTARVR